MKRNFDFFCREKKKSHKRRFPLLFTLRSYDDITIKESIDKIFLNNDSLNKVINILSR